MRLFSLYSLLGVLRLFLLINAVVISISLMYSVIDFLLSFKVKSFSLALRYGFFVASISFYTLSPLALALSAIIFLRRLVQRKLDLVFYTAGMSPLRFAAVPVILSIALSCVNLALSDSFYPWLVKNVWTIEKSYKKKQEVGVLIRDFWFIKEEEGSALYTYIGSLDVGSGRFSNLFLLQTDGEQEIQKVVRCEIGVWRENRIEVLSGTEYDFLRGRFKEGIHGETIKVPIHIRDVSLFAEKVEHVSMSALVHLYLLGSRVGFDTNPYLGEILYRVGMSLFAFFLMVPVVRSVLGRRSLRAGVMAFLGNSTALWLMVSLLDVLPSKVGVSPKPVVVLYLLYFLYTLKGVHYLHKGFRF